MSGKRVAACDSCRCSSICKPVPVLLVGARRTGARQVAAAVCRRRADPLVSRPTAITMSAAWMPTMPARIELRDRRSADRRSRRRHRGAVRRRRRPRRRDVGAREGGRPARQCDGRPRAFHLHLARDRRSRRRRGRGRHRRRFARRGAPRARADRGDAAGADRRSRQFHRPLAQDRCNGRIAEMPLRRRFWERVVDGPIGALVLAGRNDEAEQALTRHRRSHPPSPVLQAAPRAG